MTKNYKFVYFPEDRAEIREYNVTRWQFIALICCIVFLFFAGLKFTADVLIRWRSDSTLSTLKNHNQVLEEQLRIMSKKIAGLENEMNKIEKNDDELRVAVNLPLIDEDTRDVGIGGSEVVFDFENSNLPEDTENRLSKISIDLGKLEREIKLEQESYKEIYERMKKNEDYFNHLPTIRPVVGGRETDGFGYRIHPIRKVKHFHKAVDISIMRGTPIYAVADGVVKSVGTKGALGKAVIIDHGYGYETRYGHMHRYSVRKGQRIKRGDKIGEVGSSGRATAPHVHYEVRLNGKSQDPTEYYFDSDYWN